MHEERRDRLRRFAEWVAQHVTGDEKGQAQIFLDRLFQGFGHKGVLEVGGEPEFRVRKSKEDGGGTSFADLVWKPWVLIEMKRRGEDLSRHYRQAFDYWTRLVPGRPRYVVLCNFDDLWVYDFETQMDTPVDKVSVQELPDRYGPLAFLFPVHEKPTFGNDQEAVTREAADRLATCFNKLITRGVERDHAQRFILQFLVALFSEDIGLLEKYFVAQLIDECKEPADAYDLIGGLFVEMNTPGKTQGGRFKGVDYFNGGLFREPARLELYPDEIAQLREAAKSNWSQVRPEIFGTLFEHSLGAEERHAFGAHFTSPVDIMKIVGPTIVEPWRNVIENATTQKQLRALLTRMHEYHVLDPACGSGNFLYIAYRELKRLEARIYERLKSRTRGKTKADQVRFGFVTARQFFGLDINEFAVELAKVTMMIARKLAIDELHVTEPALPLDNLDKNFEARDALIDELGNPAQWPAADVIIGNPPYLDARKITLEHGRKYVASLRRNYSEIPGRADYCVYWIRKAHDHLMAAKDAHDVSGRAGLVGTNSIRQNYSRIGGLDYVVAHEGTIVDAVSSQVWSGEAAVHVSIVNWVKGEHKGLKRLTEQLGDSRDSDWRVETLSSIPSSLSFDTDVSAAVPLASSLHPKRCFEGIQPGHDGFRLTREEFVWLQHKEPQSIDLIRPYMNGTDLLSGRYATQPKYVLDFGRRDLLQASEYPICLEHIKKRVLTDWERNAANEAKDTGRSVGEHQNRLKSWWRFKRPRNEMMNALLPFKRFVVCVRHTKRPVFVFLSIQVRPDSALTAFAFGDDYSFGVLQSNAHWTWFTARCSTITRRFRYTSDTVFDTFPWPQSPSRKQVKAVAQAGLEVRRVRNDALKKIKGGLRAVYRTLELPGNNLLKDAHAALDAAVLNAYGFSARKDLLAQLLALNLDVAARIERGEAVTPPGIPAGYPKPDELVTDDCIRPE